MRNFKVMFDNGDNRLSESLNEAMGTIIRTLPGIIITDETTFQELTILEGEASPEAFSVIRTLWENDLIEFEEV